MIEITSFSGDYRWLSNFWMVDVSLDGYTYPSVEHAYQAAKTFDPGERERIWMAQTPGHAKRLGRTVTLRPDWDEARLYVMRDLLFKKFSPEAHPDLANKLMDTGQAWLEEGNHWGDVYWGTVNGVGENHLGGLLMEVRLQLQIEYRGYEPHPNYSI